MKIKSHFIVFIVLLSMVVVNVRAQSLPVSGKVLVVYFSYTGNTHALAEDIHKETGGDMTGIEPAVPYDKDYDKVVEQGKKEVNSEFKPPIKTKIADISSYDIVFIGSPVWWATIAPPVATFLSTHNLEGKKVIPFITHGGYGLGRSVADIKKLCPKSILLKEYGVEGGKVGETNSEMIRWLKSLNLKKM